MKIELSGAQCQALLDYVKISEDAEQIAEGEFTLDIYDVEPPLSMQFELCAGGIDCLACYEMRYSDALDGWHLADRLEDPAQIQRRLAAWPLLS